MSLGAILRALVLALQILDAIGKNLERKGIRADAVAEFVNQLWEEHRAKIEEAAKVRADVRSELDGLDADELRRRTDAHFRD